MPYKIINGCDTIVIQADEIHMKQKTVKMP